MQKRTYCFDLDGTLCSNTDGDYAAAEPLEERIRVVQRLYQEGHEIVIHTARGFKTGIDWTDLTKKQLLDWAVPHHLLVMGKPFADIYIDDKGQSDLDFFSSKVGNS